MDDVVQSDSVGGRDGSSLGDPDRFRSHDRGWRVVGNSIAAAFLGPSERCPPAGGELVRAAEVSRELSQLLDRRLYRMRRLFWAIQNYQLGRVTSDVLDARVADYDDVLYEWNDRLNVNLALI
jgi:hypothetical protein